MTQHAQQRRDLARVGSNADDCLRRLAPQDLIKHILGPHILRSRALRGDTIEQLVVLGEAVLDLEAGIRLLDPRLVAAMVASMQTHALAEILFHGWDERFARWKLDIAERDLSSLQASRHWTCVELLGRGDLLLGDARLPVGIRFLGRGNTHWRKMSIVPVRSGVAIEQRPVAVPGGRSVESLGSIVVTFSVPGQEQELVGSTLLRFGVQPFDLFGERLPLRESRVRLSRVGLIDEAKVGRGLNLYQHAGIRKP